MLSVNYKNSHRLLKQMMFCKYFTNILRGHISKVCLTKVKNSDLVSMSIDYYGYLDECQKSTNIRLAKMAGSPWCL